MKKRPLIAVVLAALLFPLAAIAGVKAAPSGSDGPRLRLRVGEFDAAAGNGPRVAGVRALAADAPVLATPGRAGLWVVQARALEGVPDVVAAVRATRAKLVGYVPDNAYAVYATPEQRVALVNGVGPLLHFEGPFQPAWRIEPGLTNAKAARSYSVRFFRDLTGAERAAGFQAVTRISGVRVVSGKAGDAAVRIAVDSSRLGEVASVPEVSWVSTPPAFKAMNATARWVTDTGARQVQHLTNPVGGLTGAGQTAAVADTGINYIPDVKGDAQAYFSDCSAPTTCKLADYTLTTPGTGAIDSVVDNNTAHRKMAAYFDLGASGARPADPDAHGTHTAGSVAGNVAPNAELNRADGLAWGARLVHENIAGSDGSLAGIPASDYDLFRLAYRPSNPAAADGHSTNIFAAYNPTEDARTHNDSWGTSGADADRAAAESDDLDQFVWDHEDMAIVFSAGNEATASPAQTGAIGAPATAKNDLTSGASANGDQPQVSPESLASFSSHGPTHDGRYGPDLVTPGQIVVSPKGSSFDDEQYLQGTSMSAPVLTGLATLVRQYFWDGYGPAGSATDNAGGMAVGTPAAGRRFNPSAALVKAVLVNGAKRMRGWYTGDDGTSRDQDGQYPSAGQGFGLVNLDDSLYLPNDPTSLWVRDVWRDTFNGKTATGGNPEAFTGPIVPVNPAVREYTLSVAPGQPLDVTLAWTDQPSTNSAPPSLINDLDLTVTDPDGATVRLGNNFNTRATPKATEYETPAGGSADTANNVEKVRVAAPVAGDYKVKVTAKRLLGTNTQGFSLAATGKFTGTSAPSLGAGWRTDATPTVAPAVVGTSVENFSADTAVVNLNTSELTTAVLSTSNGGVFHSVDTVDATGDYPGLPSAFTPEIPDTTGFPPAPGAHDALTNQHRILVTGVRDKNVTMTVALKDVEGKTSSVFLGTLPVESVYQPALDDIAQLSSADATYGGFNSKSTQMYLGNLTDLGNLLGAYKFTVPTSVDASTVGGAVIEASSGHDLVSHDAQQWVMKSDVLANSTEANWRSNNYASIHGAPSVATLNPSTGVRKGNQTTYAEAVTCDKMSAFKSDLADKSVAVRMEAATPDADAALSFETGANRRSRGPQFRPRLVLLKQQGDGTLLDTRPCDPNAPAPVLSDVRVEQNKNADNKTFSGVVSWHTDLPSDSTVLVRPRGANALSWVEVSVPGRTTLHVVEVKGLSLALDYEFLVSSAGCNGARGTDTNAGKGYTFVPPPDAPVTAAAGPYDFESGAQGWTVVDEPDSSGASTWALTTAAARSGSQSWSHSPYKDGADSSIVSPSFATTTGRVRLSWWQSTDLEPDFDYLHVEYSTGGAWAEVAKYTGATGDFANGVFAPQSVVFDVPPAPSMKVRFRLQADDLFSDPQYKGARVDDVTVSQGGRGVPLGAFPSKALSAKSAVTAPALPLHLTPSTADLAAGTARCAPVTTKVYVPPPPNGYWLTAADAGLFTYGDAKFYGSYGGHILNQPVVGMAAKSDHTGYWQVAADGGIFAWGSAPFKGSMGGKQLNKPVVGMAATPDGNGYWLVASDGGIFAFGNAGFYGSTGSIALNQPIVGMASTSTGKGYWLVAADGGIFAFGDAVGRFYGSAANTPKSAPVVGMEPTPLGDGYWMVTRNGAVFAFGGASSKFYGSALSKGVNNIVGMTTMANTAGYWLAGANGAVYPFGGAKDFGSAASYGLFRPVVGIEGY